jgi:PPM family protein phosphatase
VTVLRVGSMTDVGRIRTNNEDQLLVAEPLFAVADGMGGHAAGEVASQVAVEALRASFDRNETADGLADAVRAANRAVWDRAQEKSEYRGMGTTMTAIALVGDGDDEVLAVVNVGDSRTYLLRDGELDQLTEDHGLVAELVRSGQLSPQEAELHPQKNVLTRVLGLDEDVEVDCFQVVPYKGDRLLLASDGLTNEVTDAQMASVLRRLADPQEACAELVRMAKDNGGSDNITVVLVDVVDDDDRAEQASTALAGERPTQTARREPPVRDEEAAPSRPAPRPEPERPPQSRPRRFTLRVAVFVLALVLLVGAALLTVGWYARGGYYVGLKGSDVAIYKGRPGGTLWFKPTLAERTGVKKGDVQAAFVDDIEAGKPEPSLGAARRYVRNVKNAPPQPAPPSPTSTTPAP